MSDTPRLAQAPPKGEEVLPAADDVLPAGPDELVDESPLERLKAAKRGDLQTRELKLPIGEYDGELRAVYGYIEYEESQDALRDRSVPEVDRAADLLARACRRLEIRDGEGYRPLHEAAGLDEPVRFDHNAAKILELDTDDTHPSRSVVRQVYGTEYALLGHQAILIMWLSDPSDDPENFA